MVGKYIMFFEDGKPRDTLFIEKSVYHVTGLKGTKILQLNWVKTSPGATEYKKRERCHPGGHIAVITDSPIKAAEVVKIVSDLQAAVDKLSDFATNAIRGFHWWMTTPPSLPENAIRVRTRQRGA